jgi:hypothetical protein
MPDLLRNAFPRSLRGGLLRPFTLDMEISGGSALAGARYDMAVARKLMQSTREQGAQALRLIEASSAPRASAPEGVGGQLDIVA